MSFVFLDGFDCYPNISDSSNGLQGYWSVYNQYGDMSIGTGRFGGQCVTVNGYINGNNGQFTKGIPSTNTYALGFATRMNQFLTGTTDYAFQFSTLGSSSIGIGMNSNQQYYVYFGSTTLCTSPLFISVGAWHYIELEVNIDPTAGFVNLYVDGLLQASFTGNTGSSPCTAVGWGLFNAQDYQHTTNHSYDDIYVKNVATREGERKVQTLVPASDVSIQWLPSTGSSNYNLINALPVPASPTQYVYANVVTDQDLYSVTALANSPSVVSCVQIRTCAAKDNAETKTIATVIDSAGTTSVGTTYALTSSYLYYTDIYNNNPHTGGAWNKDTVDALQIGQKVIS